MPVRSRFNTTPECTLNPVQRLSEPNASAVPENYLRPKPLQQFGVNPAKTAVWLNTNDDVPALRAIWATLRDDGVHIRQISRILAGGFQILHQLFPG